MTVARRPILGRERRSTERKADELPSVNTSVSSSFASRVYAYVYYVSMEFWDRSTPHRRTHEDLSLYIQTHLPLKVLQRTNFNDLGTFGV